MLVGIVQLSTPGVFLLLLMASTAVESGTWYNNYHTDLQLAAEALQVQRQALMAILRPYMNRPDEINPLDDSDEFGQHQQLHHQTVSTRKEDVDIDQDQTTTTTADIHLRVLRNARHQREDDHSLSTPADIQRRRQPNWTMTAELVDESDGQPSVVVMESRSSLMMNTSDGHQTTINHIPMLERRSIPQFGGMVTLYTRTSPLRLLYYGNWCGSGGMGPALDSIDKCCMTHDKCYNAVENLPCQVAFQKPYTVHYAWRWVEERKQAYCLDTGDRCAYMTCQCDKVAASCFSKYAIDVKLEGNRLRKHRKRPLGPNNISNTVSTLH